MKLKSIYKKIYNIIVLFVQGPKTSKVKRGEIFKYLLFNIYSRLFMNHRQMWLVTEREAEARDNGYVLYKWIRENHPEINIVYAIRKDSKDYGNVRNMGKVVEYGSMKHWYYYMTASVCCGSTFDICVPNKECYMKLRGILPPRCKRVFLQHGIIKDFMRSAQKPRLMADIFVCGAYPEWEYISKAYGYTAGEVKYLGLARYDRLIDTSISDKPQILFMPTWRRGFKTINNLQTTTYFQRLSSVLKSDRLNRALQEYDCELVYFMHPAIKDKKKYFEKLSNEHIKVLNNDDYDLQKLICSANLLITDYSSIFFDFAYLKKPVLYYQYDYEDYRNNHYLEGYFDYKKHGFGPVLDNEDDLISEIIHQVSSGFHNDEIYIKRRELFFRFNDRNNCERTFKAICDIDDTINCK